MRFAFFLVLVLTSIQSFAQWKPAGNNIRTPWAEKLDPANPHPEYPRPQMKRDGWLNLNGLWDFSITYIMYNTWAVLCEFK